MGFDSRIGLAGLVLGFFGIAASLLWPDKRWVGWTCFGLAIAVILWWLVQEVHHHQLGLWATVGMGMLLGGGTGALIYASTPKQEIALYMEATFVGIRNMPERKAVPTWNEQPWDENEFADVRLMIKNKLDLPLRDLDLEITVTDGDPRPGIAGIAQLSDIPDIRFSKPPMNWQDPMLKLRGNDGNSYNLPLPEYLREHRIVSSYRLFCPRLGKNEVIRLILATIYGGTSNKPPDRLKISGTFTTEGESGGKGQISETIRVLK